MTKQWQVGGLISVATVLTIVGSSPATAIGSDRTPYSSSDKGAQAQARTDHATPSFAKGQFIVKFKDTLTQCAHCLLERHQRFAAALTDYSGSLDHLNQQCQVRAAKGLFMERCDHTTSQAQANERWRIGGIQSRFNRRAIRASEDLAVPDLTNVYMFEVSPGADIEAVCALYRQDPHVEYSQPNYLIKAQFIPDDPYYSSSGSWGQPYDDLWGLKKIQVEQAWDRTQGQGVVVAVVDTGVDYTHPDIEANVWRNPGEIAGNGVDDDQNGFVDDVMGWDFGNDDHDPMDRHGHGTHVAGTIAAVGNNGVGIIGVAPQATIMPVKGFSDNGLGSIDDLAQAIVYAAQNGAPVINNSWSCLSECPSNPVAEEAVRAAMRLGATVVFAAGNGSAGVANFSPQDMADPKPIVVTATDEMDRPTYFSNFGVLIDVAAPGGGVQGTARSVLSLKSAETSPDMDESGRLVVGERYLRQAGTSMAAPHAAGVVALLLAQRPDLSPELVRQILRASADDVFGVGFDLKTGVGRLNAAKALQIGAPSVQARLMAPSGITLSPQQGSAVVLGTASGADFHAYTLAYGRSPAPAEWLPIREAVAQSVEAGELGAWSISQLETGTYLLRLTVTTSAGTQVQDVTQVAIETPPTAVSAGTIVHEFLPTMSENRLVWVQAPVPRGYSDIVSYDFQTGFKRQVTGNAQRSETNPRLSGDLLVWEDYRNSQSDSQFNPDVYLYDFATDREVAIATGNALHMLPDISGNRIVWWELEQGENTADGYTCAYDRVTGTCPSQRVARGAFFRISDNRIVWEDAPQGRGVIFLHDLATGAQRQVTPFSWQLFYRFPQISGERMIYGGYDYWWHLFVYNLATNREEEIPTHQGFFSGAAIAGDRVVFADNRHGNRDIYLYDLATNAEWQITADLNNQWMPAIAGNRIVWTDERNGSADIYMAGLSPTHTITIVTPNGGERWQAGQAEQVPLRWSASCGIPSFDIALYKAGQLVRPVIDNIPAGICQGNASVPYYTPWPIPADLRSGTDYSIRVSAHDGSVSDESKPFTILAPPRSLTVLSPNGGEVLRVGDTIPIRWKSQRIDQVAIGYSPCPSCIDWIVFGLPTGPLYDPSTDEYCFNWTASGMGWPVPAQAKIKLIGYETGVGSVSDTSDHDFIVRDNHPPTLSPIGNQTVRAGERLTFTVRASDADGDPLTYQASNLPAGAVLDPDSGEFRWTPSAQQIRTYTIPVSASDGAATASTTLTVIVRPANRAPRFAVPLRDQIVQEGGYLLFMVHAIDVDGDPVTYQVDGLPSGAVIEPVGEMRRISWRPDFTQAGTYPLTITASDGSLPVSGSSTITVRNVNRRPVLEAIAQQTVRAGQTLTFALQVSDPDGDPLTFRGLNLPAGASVNPTTGMFQWTPAAGQAGVHEGVRVEVSDGSLTHARQTRIAVLSSVAIQGSVVTLIGRRPVSGVRAKLELRMPMPPWSAPSVSSASTTTDAQGRFRFDGLSPGLYMVRLISADGRQIVPSQRLVLLRNQDAIVLEFRIIGR